MSRTTRAESAPRTMFAAYWASSAALLLTACHGAEPTIASDAAANTVNTAAALAASERTLAPARAAASAPAALSPPADPVAHAGSSAAVNAAPAVREAVAALTSKIAQYGGQLGVAVMDVSSGELLAAHEDRRALNPASNAKLFTAAAALSLLHGNYRFETALYGEARAGSVPKLVLRGHGDPSLVSKDLWDMARDLKERGVRRVEGDILVDQRFFDEAFVPPAFEQQPGEWASFRAPVSAVALNENTVRMSVRPAAVDAPALVAFDPPGFVDIDGAVKTSADGHAQDVRLELVPSGGRLLAHVGGSIGAGEGEVEFTRRVDNPGLLAGFALRALLQSVGISVGGEVKTGTDNVRSLLVLHRSRPLASLLYELGKASDNFYAEMVLKTLGAERATRPGKSVDGAEVVTKYLKDIGAFDDGMRIVNGSGLYDANRVTANATVRLLRTVYNDAAISAEYVAQLAIGGVDGTLHKRFRELRDRRVVRAKTGTLEATAALSGYVLAPPGKSAIAFSIVVNNVAGKVSGTREAIDACTTAIARYLWRDAHSETHRDRN